MEPQPIEIAQPFFSQALSNGKRKGRGNTKNGNKWAYVEAANFAVRFPPEAKRYSQR